VAAKQIERAAHELLEYLDRKTGRLRGDVTVAPEPYSTDPQEVIVICSDSCVVTAESA
jgi:hypothetical protein